MKRRALLACALSLLAFLATSAAAWASFRGTDMWNNLMPDDGSTGLITRYPVSHYQIDYHVDGPSVGLSGVSTGDPGDMILQFTTSWMFFAGVVVMRALITVFQWAFSVDLITGPHGLLGPASVVSSRYYDQFALPFLVPMFLLLGGWLALKAVKRDHGDVLGSLVRVLVMTVVSLAIIFHPQDTIGRAFSLVDGVSQSIVSRGGGDVVTKMTETFIYRPWAVIEFGGLSTCTGARKDKDGFPIADAHGSTCHSVLHKDPDGHGDYAPRFLRWAPASGERKAEYDALRQGQAPSTPQFANVVIDRTDAPAVDMMQADGAGQRFAYTLLVLACMISGALLIGLVAVAALVAQVTIILLFVATPFALLAAIFPPAHRIFSSWATMLPQAIVGKAVYSIVLAVLLSTSDVLMSLGGQRGYLFMLGLQALLFAWAFKKRKWIVAKATSSRVAEHYSNHENKAVSFAAGAATGSVGTLSTGATGFASTMRDGWRSGGARVEQPDVEHASPSSMPPDSSSPPASAGREYSPPGPHQPAAEQRSASVASNGHQAPSWGVGEEPAPAPENVPRDKEEDVPTRSFQDDLKQHRAQPSPSGWARPVPVPDEPVAGPVRNDGAPFAEDLERARVTQPPEPPPRR